METIDQNADIIMNLPTNQSQPSHNELKIVETLFNSNNGKSKNFMTEVKDLLVLGILFIAFSLPFLDPFIKKFVPMADTSPYILMVAKALIFVIAYWLVKNFWLSRA